MFQLICDSNGFADEMRLAHLIHSLIQIPRYLTELTAFGGCNVDFSVRSCLGTANKYEIEFRDFLCWVQREPQSLVWLAVLHRLIHSESARHVNVRCCVCKSVPIVGLRYRCLRCFNTDFCQNCFFYGRFLKGHKLTHPMQEYCSASTSGENVRDLTRIICNKFKSKAYFSRKNLNTGFMPLHGMLIGDEILINGSYDTSFLDQPSAYDSGNMINVGNAKRVMSGTAFAQPPPHPSLSQSLLHSYQASPSNTQSLMDTAAINMQSNIHPIGSATFAPQPYMNGVTSMQKGKNHICRYAFARSIPNK